MLLFKAKNKMRIFYIVLLVCVSNTCFSQDKIVERISKNWLTAKGYEVRFDSKGNVKEDREEMVQYWISDDTITFKSYIEGGVIGNYNLQTKSTDSYDTIPANTFYSRIELRKSQMTV